MQWYSIKGKLPKDQGTIMQERLPKDCFLNGQQENVQRQLTKRIWQNS